MHPMRQIMSLTEAPRKKMLSADELAAQHQSRVAQEAARQAKEIEAAKVAAQQLKAKALSVATEVRREIYLPSWGRAWVDELRAAIQADYRQQYAAAKEELAYEREDNPNAVLREPNFYEIINETLSKWWDQKKDSINWSEGRQRLEDYYDAHRRTEQSDDMSRLQAEDEMLKSMTYKGGFGSPSDMAEALNAMSLFADYQRMHMNNGWSDSHGTVAADICIEGIPLILLYCNTVAKIGTTATTA